MGRAPGASTCRHSYQRYLNAAGFGFNIDSGSITNAPAFWGTSGNYNRFWNINLHRNFQTANGAFSVYGGWGSSAWEVPNFPSFIRRSGPRVGFDARINLRERWYLTADLGYTFGGSTTALNVYNPGPEPAWNSSVLDTRVGVGYTAGRWGLEAGYRWINWAQTGLPASASGVCPGLNCGMAWNGLYVGLNFSPTTP